MNINRIIVDIAVAKDCLSPTKNLTNDEYFYDMAAYHTQQAIEKEIKYFLQNIYGMDGSERKFKIHNIAQLLLFLNEYDNHFLYEHQDLVHIADEVTKWEASCRYGEDLVASKKEIQNALSIACNLLDEIKEMNQNRALSNNDFKNETDYELDYGDEER